MVQPIRSSAASACFALIEGQFRDGLSGRNEGHVHRTGNRLTVLQAERTGIAAELEKSPVYQAVRRFGVATGKLNELGGGAASGLKQVGQGAAKGLWQRLAGKGEKKEPEKKADPKR